MGILLVRIDDPIQRNWNLAGNAIVLFSFRFIQTFLRFPESLYQLELFSPLQFANSDLLPSLGDLLLNTIVITYLIIQFNAHFTFPEQNKGRRNNGFNFMHLFSMLVLCSYFLYTHHIFKSIIINSSISFEAFKITGLSLYSFIGLVIVGLQFASLIFLIDKIANVYKPLAIEKKIALFTSVVIVLVLALSFTGFRISSYSILYFFLIFIFLMLIRQKRDNLQNYSIIVILILLFSVYSVIFITKTTETKERQDMAILAENIANEHDPVAELLLEDMTLKMRKDSVLADMLFNMNVSYQQITKYLQNYYFKGYMSKYNFQFFDCKPRDSVIFDVPEKVLMPCYPFFDDLIESKGMHLPKSNFYYIDNINGRINYLGKFTYENETGEISIFIELESQLLTENLGYPELLLDENFREKPYLSEYSYAKYHDNLLISKFGNFHYSLNRNIYGEKNKEYIFLRFDGYDHLIYNINERNTINTE
ncbi:MAG: hypothetical protein HC906_02435 [Bacteroidales bacterium]|nr:hypothetical protein [Bacteroidales bacterium]